MLAGSANPALAESIGQAMHPPLGPIVLQRFPDGELHLEIQETLRGHEVFLVQPTGPPVGEHLLELILLVDACQRAGAACISAVIPYFGYAR